MPANTTSQEDRALDKCRDFGGYADELADCVERLDGLIIQEQEQHEKTIAILAEVTEERDQLSAYIDHHSDYLTAIDNLQE